MRKLTLDLNALEVQSFATDEVARRAFGTVHGRQQKGSEVDACPSARGCSEIAECRPTQGDNCPSAALNCETSRDCSKAPGCGDSAVDRCISERACTDVNCPVEA
ncbi:MAG TPA: hypothetical protein VF771_09135 [Longimicrobiaceae bacterium]